MQGGALQSKDVLACETSARASSCKSDDLHNTDGQPLPADKEAVIFANTTAGDGICALPDGTAGRAIRQEMHKELYDSNFSSHVHAKLH